MDFLLNSVEPCTLGMLIKASWKAGAWPQRTQITIGEQPASTASKEATKQDMLLGTGASGVATLRAEGLG